MRYIIADKRVALQGKHVYIAESACVIGSVIIGDNVSIWFQTVIRGDNDPIVIGSGSNIQDGSVLHTDFGFPLTIGQNVTIGHRAVLHGCTIGDGSLIGINAVVLNGAVIGKNCLVGANSLIPENKKIPDGSLVLGSPGKIIRTLTPADIERIHSASTHYIGKIDQYLASFRAEE